MKKRFLSLVLLAVMGLSASVNAQTIIVQKADGSNARTFTTLEAAVAGATANEYIYLSGGKYSIQSKWRGYDNSQNFPNYLVIDKPLNIIGGGRTGENTSIIEGKVILRKSAGGSAITGVVFNNQVILDSVSNTNISRCLLGDISLCGIGVNDIIIESDLNGIYGYANVNDAISGSSGNSVYSFTCHISKSIIRSTIAHLTNLTLSNNLHTAIGGGYNTYPFSYSNSLLTVENCIFIGNIYGYEIPKYSTFRNNITWDPIYQESTNIYQNNIHINTFDYETLFPQLKDIFVNYGEGDYHLKANCPGKNAGTDGTDIGIYGTASPFKENKTTSYPQFILKNVASETNGEGKVKVDLKIEAQNN